MRNTSLRCVAVAAVFLCSVAPVHGQTYAPELFDALKYRHVGPVGNRVIALAGIPDESHTYYIGTASGGIFLTTDGGINWEPIFDEQDVSPAV